MPKPQAATLATICAGRVEQQFQHALRRLHENINDPATAPSAVRKIVIELAFKPGHDREGTVCLEKVTTKLAQPAPGAPSEVYFGEQHGEPVITTASLHQVEAFSEVETAAAPTDTILRIGRKGA